MSRNHTQDGISLVLVGALVGGLIYGGCVSYERHNALELARYKRSVQLAEAVTKSTQPLAKIRASMEDIARQMTETKGDNLPSPKLLAEARTRIKRAQEAVTKTKKTCEDARTEVRDQSLPNGEAIEVVIKTATLTASHLGREVAYLKASVLIAETVAEVDRLSAAYMNAKKEIDLIEHELKALPPKAQAEKDLLTRIDAQTKVTAKLIDELKKLEQSVKDGSTLSATERARLSAMFESLHRYSEQVGKLLGRVQENVASRKNQLKV